MDASVKCTPSKCPSDRIVLNKIDIFNTLAKFHAAYPNLPRNTKHPYWEWEHNCKCWDEYRSGCGVIEPNPENCNCEDVFGCGPSVYVFMWNWNGVIIHNIYSWPGDNMCGILLIDNNYVGTQCDCELELVGTESYGERCLKLSDIQLAKSKDILSDVNLQQGLYQINDIMYALLFDEDAHVSYADFDQVQKMYNMAKQ